VTAGSARRETLFAVPGRRLLTVPVAIVLFVMVTALMPLFAVLALIVDLVRWVRHKIPFVAIRVTAASWVYLAVEMFGLAVDSCR
jgi:hypothetical protein